jgi:hypothetical protein
MNVEIPSRPLSFLLYSSLLVIKTRVSLSKRIILHISFPIFLNLFNGFRILSTYDLFILSQISAWPGVLLNILGDLLHKVPVHFRLVNSVCPFEFLLVFEHFLVLVLGKGALSFTSGN